MVTQLLPELGMWGMKEGGLQCPQEVAKVENKIRCKKKVQIDS